MPALQQNLSRACCGFTGFKASLYSIFMSASSAYAAELGRTASCSGALVAAVAIIMASFSAVVRFTFAFSPTAYVNFLEVMFVILAVALWMTREEDEDQKKTKTLKTVEAETEVVRNSSSLSSHVSSDEACSSDDDDFSTAALRPCLHPPGAHADSQDENSVIRAYAQRGNVAMATKWFGNVLKADTGNCLRRVQCETYHAVIDACIRKSDLECCDQWQSWMHEAGFTSDVSMLEGALRAAVAKGDVKRGCRWLEMMQEALHIPVASLYTSMICAAAMKGDVASALQSLKWMSTVAQLTPDGGTLAAVVRACADKGDLKRLDCVAEEWLTSSSGQHPELDNATLASVEKAFAQLPDVKRSELWAAYLPARS